MATITTLPPLYSRTSKDAVNIWTITVDGPTFYTSSGQIHGKQNVSRPTICEARNIGRANATTAEQQAVLEAQAKWDKKRKTGYFPSIEEIDDFYFVEAMLATPLHNVKGGVKFPCLLQTKYNGVRCIATADGLYSRKGEPWKTIPHIMASLRPFFEIYPEAVLDGELFNEDLRQNLNELTSIVRKTVNITPDVLKRSQEIVQFYIYDGYGFRDTTEETPYSVRKAHLDNILTEGGFGDYAAYVQTTTIVTEAHMWAAYQELVDDKHEGAIIRYSDATYEHKRTKRMIKLKPEDDAEAVVVDIQPGLGNWAGKAKVLTLQWNGKEFNASFKGTMEQAEKFLAEKHLWIGREITFLYTGLTGLGVPHVARVDINNCLKNG